MQQIVQLAGVSKTYGQGDVLVHALQNVTLGIAAGSFAAVAGPSGSGKTTLLNLMSGLDSVTSGNVFLEGRDITALGAAALSHLRLTRIGFVFQAYNLLPVLTAYENAEYVLMLQGVRAAERRKRVMSMLDRVGLAALADRYPRELSGGQQQRVAIARAIVSEPALVLADEPTANVDSTTGTALLDLMHELNRERGVTFLFSSHDEKVLKRATRLVVLEDGSVTSDTCRDDSPVTVLLNGRS